MINETAIAAMTTGNVMPRHVAIIMDGNGRWAKQRGLPRIKGHQRGAEAVRATVKAAISLGIEHLTFYAFSTENWRRPRTEVNALMQLLRHYIRQEAAELMENGVRVAFIGDRSGLATNLQKLMVWLEELTAKNEKLHMYLAINYGSRADIAAASRELAERVARGELDPSDLDEDMLGSALWSANVPDPDLLIRTSGEQRISNFLLWELAYSEMVFLDTLWPDFDRSIFEEALQLYDKRERRYGAVVG